VNSWHPLVARRAGNRCEYCLAREEVHNSLHEIDHIVPRSAGGRTHPDNLALACRACNGYKLDQEAFLDPKTGQPVRLFHPRTDRWDDHFAFDAGTGEIVGRTAVGRVTVDALALNDHRQVAARLLWMSFGKYP
jgi:hypothetical protein